jgi:hypothetical protein
LLLLASCSFVHLSSTIRLPLIKLNKVSVPIVPFFSVAGRDESFFFLFANSNPGFSDRHQLLYLWSTSKYHLGVQVDYNVMHFRTSLVQLFVLLLQNFENGTASARTSDPGTRIGHLLSHTIRIRKHISRWIMMLRSVLRMLRTPFLMLRTPFPMLRPLPPPLT